MAAHYTYFNALTHDADVQKTVLALTVASALLLIGGLAASRVRSPEGIKKHIIPSNVSTTSIFDFIISAFLNYHDSIAGARNRRYASLSATVFLFVLISNLLGLIPGMPAITTSVWVNVGMAIVVFLSFNYYGIRSHGFWRYIKHFAGPDSLTGFLRLLSLLIFPLEILSTCLRILTLNLRLYWNITADHVVLGVFTDLTKYVVPVLFYGLGTFVSFMQAFVFATLTMVYIFLAVDHGEEEHH